MEKKRPTEKELLRILQSKQEELTKLNEEKEHLESLNKDAKRIIEAQREREDQESEYVENPLNDPDNIDVTEEPEQKEESKKELTKEEALKQFFESKRTKKK